jgi:hypothetical protein
MIFIINVTFWHIVQSWYVGHTKVPHMVSWRGKSKLKLQFLHHTELATLPLHYEDQTILVNEIVAVFPKSHRNNTQVEGKMMRFEY